MYWDNQVDFIAYCMVLRGYKKRWKMELILDVQLEKKYEGNVFFDNSTLRVVKYSDFYIFTLERSLEDCVFKIKSEELKCLLKILE